MKKKPFFDAATGPFRKQTAFSMTHQTYRDCAWYPCHPLPEGQDHLNCLFCYCPFYPCENRVGNGVWITGKNGNPVWDCTPCTVVHRDDSAALIMELLFRRSGDSRIQKKIRGEFGKENAGASRER